MVRSQCADSVPVLYPSAMLHIRLCDNIYSVYTHRASMALSVSYDMNNFLFGKLLLKVWLLGMSHVANLVKVIIKSNHFD